MMDTSTPRPQRDLAGDLAEERAQDRAQDRTQDRTLDHARDAAPAAEGETPRRDGPSRPRGGRGQGKDRGKDRNRDPGRDSRPRAPKRDIDGWVLLDKPVGVTSTQAVSMVKRLYGAKKAGHAGTLDPLASGCLPIAFGEATKTVPYVMDGRKAYRFTVRFGIETDTDDAEGAPVGESDLRPADGEILDALGAFRGEILQVPPAYSALKIAGERAYDLAREGEAVVLEARPVTIYRLDVVERLDPDHVVLEAECGKGTYVRAIARDLGRMLGALGHVSALRRTRVGTFEEADLVPFDELEARAAEGEPALRDALEPVDIALEELPQLSVTPQDAHRLRCGQAVILRGRDAPIHHGHAAVFCQGALIAIGDVDGGEVFPHRVFNWSRQG